MIDDLRAMRSKEITFDEFIQRKPKRIYSMSNIMRTYDNMCRESIYDDAWRSLEITYIYGKTGKGKTRYVAEKYGYKNIYRVTKYDHTAFDTYKGQDVVVFEEFRSSCKIEEMLNYLDGHPMQLPSRYMDKAANFTKVFILTNWPLEMQYKNIQEDHPETWRALNRRIKNVYNIDNLSSKQKLFSGEPAPNPYYVPEPEQPPMQVVMEMVPIPDDDLPF